MKAMEAETVIELGELEPVLVLLRQRKAGTVVLIEDAKFNDESPRWLAQPAQADGFGRT